MGILHRKDKEYDQARRAYIQALKINSTNESCLRDLCQLQMHLRDYAGFQETRRQMLLKNAGDLETWTTYATSCYLAGDFDNCLSAMESIFRFEAEAKKPLKPNQKLELLILNFKALEAKGNFKKALKFLTNNQTAFVD